MVPRRKFVLTGLAASAGAIVGASILGRGIRAVFASPERAIRIRPADPSDASPAFRRFCERSRFRSASHAIRSVRNADTEFIIFREATPAEGGNPPAI